MESSSKQPHCLTIFTDGACSGNPGPGGWGAIILWPDGRVKEIGGGQPQTTNNRMELLAAIAALRLIADEPSQPARVYTDSTYVISGITSWIAGWKRKGWRTYSGGAVLNRDLWEELDGLASARGNKSLSWHYVKGHSGLPGNERCDEIAVSFSKGVPEPLYEGSFSNYGCDILTTALSRNAGEG